jgi:small GTP-binding protein
VPLTLWDTAGQEEYRSLVNLYFRSTQVAIIVFDLSDARTLEAVHQWHHDLTMNCCDTDPDVILVGNKLDIREREVPEDRVEALMEEIHCRYFEVSALEGTNIKSLFRSIGTTAAARARRPIDEGLAEVAEPSGGGGSCC